MFQEQAQGIFPVVVDDQAVSSRKGFEDGLPFLIGDKYDNLVISLWDVDGLQFCAPFPVEQIFVNYLVRDIHDAFRNHFTVLHFADHAGNAIPVDSGGEIVTELARALHVDRVGDDIRRAQLDRNERAAVGPRRAERHVKFHPAFLCSLCSKTDV